MGAVTYRIEALFALNVGIGLLLLWLAALVAWVRPSWWRLGLSAALGGVVAVVPPFVPGTWWLVSGPAVLTVATAMLMIAFWPCPMRQLASIMGGFWMVAGGSGGVIALLRDRFWVLPDGGSPPLMLVVSGVVAAAIALLVVVKGFRERRLVRVHVCRLRIRVGETEVILDALADSGNALRTPIAGRPVVVAEADRLAALLPAEVAEAVSLGWECLDTLPPGWRVRCQLIPYSAVGNRDGTLLVFSPDQLALHDPIRGRWVAVDGVVGLVAQPLDSQGAYGALLPAPLLARAESA